jgi:hypothetical protein
MEDLDDLMRKKFDSDDPAERFEFSEEYWEQARILLEKEEKRRRKGGWWWLVPALIVCAAGGLYFGYRSETTPKLLGATPQDAPQRQTGIHPAAQPDKPSEPADSISVPARTNSSDENNTLTAIQEKNDNLESAKPGPNTSNTANTISAFHKSKSPRTGKTPETPTPAILADGRKTASSETTNKGLSATKPEKNQVSTPNAAEKQPAVPQTAPTNSTDRQAPELNTSPATFRQLPILLLPVGLTPLPLQPTAIPALPRSKAGAPALATPGKPFRERKFSWDAGLSGSVNEADSSGKWAGLAAGISGNYRFGKHWGVSLGLHWRFAPGLDAPYPPSADSLPNVAHRLVYSFGFNRETRVRSTTGLHFFEVPLSLRYQKGAWQFAGGVAGQWLLAVHQRTRKTDSSSLEPNRVAIQRFVRGDKSRYTTFGIAVLAGADYTLNRRFSIASKLQYRFTPLFNIAQASPRGLGSLDLGIKYRF